MYIPGSESLIDQDPHGPGRFRMDHDGLRVRDAHGPGRFPMYHVYPGTHRARPSRTRQILHGPGRLRMDNADFAWTMSVPHSETLMDQADLPWTMRDPAFFV
jgi:hypothetical protein